MALSTEILAQVAFKNLLGKSQVQKNFGVNNESYGYFLNVPSSNVWLTPIPFNDPATAVNNQVSVKIIADLVQISDGAAGESKFLSYQTVWGSTPSVFGGVKDPKTNQAFEFGKGSLKDVTAGSNIYDLIPDSNGLFYQVAPYVTYPTGQIAPGDSRDWVYQYSSGIFYQDKVITSLNSGYQVPTKIVGYYYIGDKLSTFNSVGPEVIRVSATGPDASYTYYADNSTPFISTYSVNHLYLVDFAFANTTSVKLNIDYIGTSSVYKYGLTGLGELSSNDIKGGTGLTSGPLYYLTWNTDGYFLFFESNPTQPAGLFKDEVPTSNKVGGIDTGSSFDSVSFQDMFVDLLYPERLSNINSLSISNPGLSNSSISEYKFIDVGRQLTGVLTFSWNYSNGSDFAGITLSIADITPNPIPTSNWPAPKNADFGFNFSTQLGTFSYAQPVYSNVPDRRIYSILGKRKNNTYIRKYGEIQWTWRSYYGSSTFSTLTPRGVTALPSQLMTYSLGNFLISGTQGYKYIAFPDNSNYNFKSISYYGLPVVLATNSYNSIDSNGNNYATLTITNSYNLGTTYRIYRTLNQITGTLSVNITN